MGITRERFRELILVRLGEITLKGRTREKFEAILIRNMRSALKSGGIEARVERGFGRIFVYSGREAVPLLRRVFGIWSLSPAVEVEYSTLEELLSISEEVFREAVRGKTFAVRARRIGVSAFTSRDIEREVGSRLLRYSAGVDLEKPEVTAYIEVRGRRAYLYTEVVQAYGGLPVGSEGRVLALISGGFDSAVAAWYMLKRGAEVHYLFCNMGGELAKLYAARVAKVMADNWSYGYSPKLYVADFRPLLADLARKVDHRVLGVVLKRFMYRAAELIAREIGAHAIVTGESLGQVSSQTLVNLHAIDRAVAMPVLRPLIGFDKEEIIRLAREIGVYEEASLVREICGAYSYQPRTACSLEEVLVEESKVGSRHLESILGSMEVLNLRDLSWDDLAIPNVDIDSLPRGSVVLDVRPTEKYSAWHIPGSINVDAERVVELAQRMGRDRTYVVVCDEGGLSREIAHNLRLLGFTAYSLRGGIRRARRQYSKLLGVGESNGV
ncbi:MAG: tRNA uracil 4-sulfurtransferase ThiI [Thermofilum sp.]